ACIPYALQLINQGKTDDVGWIALTGVVLDLHQHISGNGRIKLRAGMKTVTSEIPGYTHAYRPRSSYRGFQTILVTGGIYFWPVECWYGTKELFVLVVTTTG